MNLAHSLEAMEVGGRVDPYEIPQRDASTVLNQLRLFRITSDQTTTSTTSTTSTSSTSSTTSTTTTSTTSPNPCFGRVWRAIAIDAAFSVPAAGFVPLVTIERAQDSFYLFAHATLALRVNDIVLAANINGVWLVLEVYGNCPQASVTTTTTTTTSTTSSTTPPPHSLPT